MLTAQQHAFVLEFPKDWNGAQAAIRVGVAPGNASTTACRWLANVNVVAAIEERKKDLAARAGLSVEWVLRGWKEIAEADPNDLVSYVITCCRHCYGKDHQFQWNQFEFNETCKKAREHLCTNKCEQPCVKRIPPLPIGGFDFDPQKPPAADCPVCKGEGQQTVKIADTRRVTGSARRLYAGVKQTQHGIEVKMHDQMEARKLIAQYFGMLVDKRELSVPGGITVNSNSCDPKDLTDEQLIQLIKRREEEAAKTVVSSS
jgi:phage terminase small subunit